MFLFPPPPILPSTYPGPLHFFTLGYFAKQKTVVAESLFQNLLKELFWEYILLSLKGSRVGEG